MDPTSSSKEKVLITGASGFIGTRLIELFDRPLVTSRNRERTLAKLGDQVEDVIEWDPNAGPIQLAPETRIDSVINLMGESVGEGRWTAAKKQRIRTSRVAGTRNLVTGIAELNTPPKHLVSTSAVGLYGECGDDEITEDHSPGDGFLADLAVEWEQEAIEAKKHGMSVALIRVGLVLGRSGGVLAKLLPIFKFGLGGKLASGQQWMPWIHVEDVANIFYQATCERWEGAFNATSPEPVRNVEFTLRFANQLGRWALIPVPRFGLSMALGEFSRYVLESQRVIPRNVLSKEFEFRFADLESALEDLLSERK